MSREHDVRSFSSGEEEVDSFLRDRALRSQEHGKSGTLVAVEASAPKIIVGFVTLVQQIIRDSQVPKSIARALKIMGLRGGAPAFLIAQLGVDRSRQGQGVGRFLLQQALLRCVSVAAVVGGVAVFVDLLRPELKRFYVELGFRELEPEGLRMWQPLETVRRALKN